MPSADTARATGAIAITGMACRFPGARNKDVYWKNLVDGVETVQRFSTEQLREMGVNDRLIDDPSFIWASGYLEGVETFDAAFFGYSPREAELIDPQQRLFLETAWEALEGAGYNAEAYGGSIGVYAGVSLNTYWINLLLDPAFRSAVANFQTAIGND